MNASYERYLDDQWERQQVESERYQEFCDAHDLDPDSEEAEEAWEAYVEEVSEPDPDEIRDQWLDMQYEDRYDDGF